MNKGFRKEELKVQAKDRERSLTVSGQRVRVDADKRVVRFRFRFRFLMSDICDLGAEGITATFNEEKGVLALTVPKRPTPAIILHVESIEGTIKEATEVSKEELAVIEGTIMEATGVSKEELAVREDTIKLAVTEGTKPATDKKQQLEEDDAGDAEQHKVKGRRTEEERASEATAAPEEAKECQKTAAAARRGFKERVAEELQGLAGSEWAEGLVDTVNKNKEVIAVAVAAFSLGLFVCRLSSKH